MIMDKRLSEKELALLKAIRKETGAPCRDIIDGIAKYGVDHDKVVNYLREIAIVYA